MSEWKKVFENNVSLYCRVIIQYLIKSGWKRISIDDYTKKMPDFPVKEAVLSKLYKKEGLFPIVSQSKDLISGFSDDEKLLNKISEPIIIFGDHTQVVKYIDFDFVLGADGTKILTVTNDYNPKFFYYLIKSIDLHSNKYARHYSKLRKEKIPFQESSLPIQSKIVSFLDSLENNKISDESYFDNETEQKILSLQKDSLNIQLIEKEIESQKNYIKQLRQNILQDAIEGKLTTDWRKQNPVQKGNPDYDAEALFEQIQKECSNEKKQKEFSPITDEEKTFKIPEGWKWVRLGEISENCLGKMLDSAKNQGIKRKYLRNLNVRWFSFDLSDVLEMKIKDDELDRCSAQKGDLLICEGGYPGRSAIWNEDYNICFQKAVHRVRFYGLPDMPRLFNYFLFFLSESGRIENYLTGEGIKHLTGIKLKQIKIPLPSLTEQKEIVKQVEKHFQTVFELENQIAEREQITKQLMQSILKDAFKES